MGPSPHNQVSRLIFRKDATDARAEQKNPNVLDTAVLGVYLGPTLAVTGSTASPDQKGSSCHEFSTATWTGQCLPLWP